MPATVKKRGSKYRLVEKATGRLVRNRAGTPVDGGGHVSKQRAIKQLGAIETPKDKQRKK